MSPVRWSLALTLAAASGALLVGAESPAMSKAPPLFQGLGTHKRTVTTKSPEAQKYFDQGLQLVFGFNHGAAIRSFKEAARLDPDCAMAHWGIALASGPHINFPMVPPPMAEQAWSELQLALKNSASATPVEKALIQALTKRYAMPQPEDRGPLDKAYADAMREVWKKFPKDPDVGVFFAESMMDLRPWDQWTPEGQAQPGTDEIIATLDAVLKLEIGHPFANHLYIHAVEASPHPDRAIPAADRLRDAQPGLGHNVHMPSHIDIRVGHWHEAVTANLKAVEAAKKTRALSGPAQGLIVMYDAHNHQMLTWAAMMTGQSNLALKHVREMVDTFPEDVLKEFAMMVEGMAAMPYEVLVRFGRWDEMLAEPDKPDWMPLTRALRRAGRGIALAAKGDTKAAREEQAAFLELAKTIPADEALFNNPAQAIIAIAKPMLEGEILVREGKLNDGLAQLREAVKAEDALKYDEPPGWVLPVRHSLGATLMAAGRYAEAEQVYRDDLKHLAENGWSLFGLAHSLQMQRKGEKEAADLDARFKKIWAKADLKLTSSCFCQPGT